MSKHYNHRREFENREEEVIEEVPVQEEVVEEVPVQEEVIEEVPVQEEVIEEVPVQEEVVEEPINSKGVVICGRLNVRKEASKNSEILTVVPKDLIMTICDLNASEDFYKVLFGDIEGYCMKKFIKIL